MKENSSKLFKFLMNLCLVWNLVTLMLIVAQTASWSLTKDKEEHQYARKSGKLEIIWSISVLVLSVILVGLCSRWCKFNEDNMSWYWPVIGLFSPSTSMLMSPATTITRVPCSHSASFLTELEKINRHMCCYFVKTKRQIYIRENRSFVQTSLLKIY